MERAIRVPTPESLGVPRLGPGPRDWLSRAAHHLLAAERPLIVTDRLGRDVAAVEALSVAAQEFALAVRATRHRMNIADDHPGRLAAGDVSSSGVAESDALVNISNADAILVIEQEIPWIPDREQPGTDTWVGVLGGDPASLETPIYEFPATERVVGSAAVFLQELVEEMRHLRKPHHSTMIENRWRTFEAESARRLSEREEMGAKRVGPISPGFLGWALNKVLRPEDVLTWEMTDTNGVVRSAMNTLFDSGGSSLGWAVAAAVGAQMADPGRFAACLTGDGSYMFGSPTALLWTQAQYDAPVLTVIANNRGYRTGTVRLFEDYPDGYAARDIDLTGGIFDPPPDFAAQAEAAGGFGRKVLTRTELIDALRAARVAVEKERRPAVVDVWLPAHITGEHPLTDRIGS